MLLKPRRSQTLAIRALTAARNRGWLNICSRRMGSLGLPQPSSSVVVPAGGSGRRLLGRDVIDPLLDRGPAHVRRVPVPVAVRVTLDPQQRLEGEHPDHGIVESSCSTSHGVAVRSPSAPARSIAYSLAVGCGESKSAWVVGAVQAPASSTVMLASTGLANIGQSIRRQRGRGKDRSGFDRGPDIHW